MFDATGLPGEPHAFCTATCLYTSSLPAPRRRRSRRRGAGSDVPAGVPVCSNERKYPPYPEGTRPAALNREVVSAQNLSGLSTANGAQVTASEPSPTANPTRLVDPERMSPAASTPGRVVSSGQGRDPLCGHSPNERRRIRSADSLWRRGRCPPAATPPPVRRR